MMMTPLSPSLPLKRSSALQGARARNLQSLRFSAFTREQRKEIETAAQMSINSYDSSVCEFLKPLSEPEKTSVLEAVKEVEETFQEFEEQIQKPEGPKDFEDGFSGCLEQLREQLSQLNIHSDEARLLLLRTGFMMNLVCQTIQQSSVYTPSEGFFQGLKSLAVMLRNSLDRYNETPSAVHEARKLLVNY